MIISPHRLYIGPEGLHGRAFNGKGNGTDFSYNEARLLKVDESLYTIHVYLVVCLVIFFSWFDVMNYPHHILAHRCGPDPCCSFLLQPTSLLSIDFTLSFQALK